MKLENRIKKGHIPDSYLLGLVNSSYSFTYLQQLRFGGLFGFDCRHFKTSGPALGRTIDHGA